jgi:hypothetical protein
MQTGAAQQVVAKSDICAMIDLRLYVCGRKQLKHKLQTERTDRTVPFISEKNNPKKVTTYVFDIRISLNPMQFLFSERMEHTKVSLSHALAYSVEGHDMLLIIPSSIQLRFQFLVAAA